MLKALYDYALSHELALPEGYVKKTVAAYIMFSSEAPDFIEIWMGDDLAVPCPDIGSLANGKDKSNIIVEKRSVVIPDEENAKSRFFLAALARLGEVDQDAKLCAEKLANPELLQNIREKLDQNKIKPTNRISFMVDSRKLHDSPHLLTWWQSFRQEILPPKKGELAPCLITGEPTLPVSTAPPVSGLQVVGGHARGDALICFDKPAFCSYGQKQGANAPVSELAMNAVKSALNDLLKGAPILCGMKFVHWYDKDVIPEEDPILSADLFGIEVEDEPEPERTKETELRAKKTADALVGAVKSGGSAILPDTGYHILLLSGVNGRAMVRRYERGRYEELQANLDRWNQDLSLVNPYGTGLCQPMKLRRRLIRLLKYQKSDKKTLERLGKELSGITPAILMAILSGGPLPDTVAVRALSHIRSKLLSAQDNEKTSAPDTLDRYACQWLKVWLRRHTERRDEHLKEVFNPSHPEPAYHCGSAMAVYEAIQNTAMPNVNVTVVQRYYASCIQTPALVLGRLSQHSIHHLEKIDSKYLRNYYHALLEQANAAIGPHIPVTLNLKQQSYFALGYYQMAAHIRQARINAANQKNEQEEA